MIEPVQKTEADPFVENLLAQGPEYGELFRSPTLGVYAEEIAKQAQGSRELFDSAIDTMSQDFQSDERLTEEEKKLIGPSDMQMKKEGGFFSAFFAPKGAKQYAAEDIKNWPSDEEAAAAVSNGFAYGKDETLLTGEAVKVLSVLGQQTFSGPRGVNVTIRDAAIPVSGARVGNPARLTNTDDPVISRMMELPEPAKAEVVKTALVANQIPIAALGFDMRKVLLDVTDTKTNISGLYSPGADGIYAQTRLPGTLLHESIHRGMELIAKEDPGFVKEVRSKITEEALVRYFMYKFAGNPETGQGAAGDAQIKSARWMFEDSGMGYSLGKMLNKLNEKATEIIQKRSPKMGPR